MRIDLYHHILRDEDEGRLARIEGLLTALITQGANSMATMQEAMDALTAEVTRNTTVDESAIALINGLADQIAALAQEGNVQAILALTAKMKADSDGLAAAVTANTPATPA
jgi:uncharacterized membrane protein